jgi:hypothetical protein
MANSTDYYSQKGKPRGLRNLGLYNINSILQTSVKNKNIVQYYGAWSVWWGMKCLEGNTAPMISNVSSQAGSC